MSRLSSTVGIACLIAVLLVMMCATSVSANEIVEQALREAREAIREATEAAREAVRQAKESARDAANQATSGSNIKAIDAPGQGGDL
jgi:F0F1-type ATP synthase membrane subunit b/b'